MTNEEMIDALRSQGYDVADKELKEARQKLYNFLFDKWDSANSRYMEAESKLMEIAEKSWNPFFSAKIINYLKEQLDKYA